MHITAYIRTYIHTYLFKHCINLLQKGRFGVLKEHPQLGPHVHPHDTKQVDGGRSHSWVGGLKGLVDVVNVGLDVDAVGRRGEGEREGEKGDKCGIVRGEEGKEGSVD